ncbi:MAG: hypothetical protein ACE5FQ_12795 [Thiogranum sp.]
MPSSSVLRLQAASANIQPVTERHKTSITGRALVILSGALLFAVLVYMALEPANVEPALPPSLLNRPVAFDSGVRPVLERRCVVCHGCYDAPCQLKLSSNEGLRRGASEEPGRRAVNVFTACRTGHPAHSVYCHPPV